MNPLPDIKLKTIYVAGPMRGYPEFNFPTFHAVAWAMRLNGHIVFSPAEKDIERHGTDISKGNNDGSLEKAKATHGFSLRQALSEDLEFICLEANTILMLPGWEASAGSMAEHRTAAALKSEGMEIIYLSQELVDVMRRGHQIYLQSGEQAGEQA